MLLHTEKSNFGLISALVIDDNAFDRRRLARIADDTDLDFFIKEVGSVQEFGHILDQEKFDVIYVDLNLAGEDGTKLLPGVRAHHTNRDAAMIMIAGNNQAEEALRAIRAGFADYIEKEVLSPATLERATVNALQKSRLTRAAISAEEETKSIEKVLKSFATACSHEMRPMMTRMVRQVRQMKSEAETLGIQSKNLVDIEQTCARMDEFFQDLGSMATAGNLSSVIGASVAASGASAPHDESLAAGEIEKVAPKRHVQASKAARIFSRG